MLVVPVGMRSAMATGLQIVSIQASVLDQQQDAADRLHLQALLGYRRLDAVVDEGVGCLAIDHRMKVSLARRAWTATAFLDQARAAVAYLWAIAAANGPALGTQEVEPGEEAVFVHASARSGVQDQLRLQMADAK